MPRIPFISSVIRHGIASKQALKGGRKAQALYHGSEALGSAAFPVILGQLGYSAYKDKKTLEKEVNKLLINKQAGFVKESNILSLLLRGATKPVRLAAKHPGKAALVGAGGVGVHGAYSLKKALEESKKIYGPRSVYRGQLAR